MQTKFYFLLAALVGFSSFSGKLVAQSACFGYGSEPSPQAGYQLHVEEYMTFDGSEAQPALAALAGQTTYRVYLQTPGAGDFVSAVMADGVTGTGEVHLNTTTTFYKNQFGGLTPNQINPLLFSYFPALEYDSFVTIGLDQEAVGSSQGDIMLLNEGEWGPQFLSGGDLDIDASVAVAGGGWFVLGAASNGFAGEDNKVLLAQLTTTGELSGSLNVQIFPEDGGSNAAFTHQFSFTSELCGCTDASADNYVPTATIDDGSCEYFGCMDASACNFDSGANVDDGSCDYCCAQVTSTNENYSVDVELFDAGGINGLRTYRVYVHTSSELDALSAVAGYESSPAHVSTTTSFFQVPAPSGGVTPNALNPIFLEFLPDLEFDSFVTIGLSSAPTGGQQAISIAETPSSPWTGAFEAGGNISISSASGGAWFVTPGAPNAVAGPDKKVLIGQFTTDGDLSGQLLVQIFPEGVQVDEVQFEVSFSTPPCACTDATACNFDNDALYDDGTCEYADDFYGVDYLDCDGECLNDSDGDYVCDEDEVPGCLNPSACNYVDPSIVTDLVACQFPDFGYDCDGVCNNDADGDGVCDEFEVVDCTDMAACNYNSDSLVDTDNSLCIYPDAGYDCEGNCLTDTDGDGVCDEFEVNGCDDVSACNYDADATENDGSCDYCCHIGAAVSGYSVSVEEHGDSPEGTVYRMYVNTTGSNDFVSAITGTSAAPTMITTTQDFYQAPGYNSPFPTDFNAFVLGLIPELSYDSWVTIGLEMAGGAGEGGPDYVASTDWVQTFNAGGDIVMNSQYGDGWFVTINQSNGLAGDDNRVLVGQFTTNGVLSGELFVQIFPNSDQTSALELTLPFGWASENSGEAPVFTSVPADVALACTDGLPTEMATAEAVMCGGNTVVTFEDITVSGACAGSSTFERVFTATDGWGNTATASQFIELSDTEAPVAVAQEDLVVECGTDITPGAGTAEFPTASYDDCAADLSYDYSDAPYTGSYDLTGATCDIRVEMGLDVPGLFGQPYVLEATGVTVGDGSELTLDDIVQNPVSHRGAIVVDIDGGAINLSFEGAVTPNTNSYQYDYARVIVSNMSADVSGVSVNSNGIAPGADLNAGLTADGFVIEWSGTAVYTEGETASLNAEDETTCLNNEGVVRTWTVSDDCGNESYAVQTIIFEDTTGPEFTSLPADMTHSCDESPEYGSAVAEDCEGSVAVTVSESTIAGSCAANMTIVRTFTATDNCGNTSVATQTIEVVDYSAPVFTFVPADATYDVGADIQDDLATAEDNCGGASVTFFDASDASAGTYTVITRTFVATDDCGNTAEAIQLITVNEVVGCTDSTACNYNEDATYEDGSCDFCSCGLGGASGFGLELEVYAENGIPGMNTYRVYVTTPGPDDFISAVAGDVNNPAYLRTTTSFFQSQFGGLFAHEINPLFFAVLPSVMYDSWLTIGISQSPSDAAGESDISYVQYNGGGGDPADTWTTDFENGGDLEINSFFGGSWYALISATNGLAGEDNRVLVAQLTTDGDVTGELYVQVFPNGDQSQDAYLNLSFGGTECGCTDDMACNYDANAIYDNGTCTYASDIYGSEFVDCDGVCFNDADGDGICDEEEVTGCTDAAACNYDMEATDDNGTCEYLDVCTGCTDATACNYNMNAAEDDGSCEYPESGFDCEGNCLDINNDLICDAIQGCDDPTACNYDPSVEQPSADFCDYCSCPNIETSNPDYSIEIEEYAVDAVLGATTYRVYVTTANPTDALNAILGNESNPIVLGSSSQFFQDPAGDVFPTNPMMFGFTPQLEWDSYVTIGDNTPADVLDFPMASNGTEPTWLAEFEAGGSIVIDDEVGNGWYVEAGLGGQYGIAGDDNRVLVAQLTTPGTLFGSLYLQIFPEGQAADNTIYVAASFGDSRCGCTDEDACNYNGAGSDDGSCYYSDDCENSCLYDVSAPTIDAVEDYTVSCDEVDTDIRQPEGSDNCDGDLSWSYTDAIELGSCDNAYTIIRTWTAMDNSGYTASADQTITVEDNTDPTFTAPADVEVACGSDLDDLTMTGDVTDAMDNCGDVTMSYSDANGTSNCFDGDVIIRTWTATDACGNTSSATQTIHLIDEVAPYFTSVPADISLSCGDALPTDMAEAADACSSVEVTVTETSGDVSCTGLAAVIRTFRATDGCGNFTTATQTITFVDDQAPSFTAPADAEVACGGDSSPEMTGTPSDLSDNCSSDLSVDYSDAVATSADGCFADDQIIRTWVVTDACGNSSESVQTIQFVDEVAPVMDAVEATIEITCGQEIPADMPGATDACSAVEVTFADAAGDVNCTGMAAVVRTFTATDACGNSTSATTTFVYTDDTAPTFTVPADLTVECSTDLNDLSIVGDASNVEDNCAASIDVDYTDSYSTSEGSCLADNVVTRTWTVTDGCGNASEAVQTITLEDTTAPEVNFEAVVNLTYYNGEQLPEFEGVTVNDACSDWDHETTDVYTSVNGYGYTLHRTIVVTDACGNSTTIEQDINVDLYGGCTYEEAFNFDPTAVLDDGSCEYAGCTDPAAANYDELFTVEDGSCLIVGCMDPDGLDYNPEATFPGGCDYPDPCPGDLNEDGNVNVGDLLEFFQLYGTVCE
jgi:hypothetical protein